jgi:hypothetical protein
MAAVKCTENPIGSNWEENSVYNEYMKSLRQSEFPMLQGKNLFDSWSSPFLKNFA